jgi:hypothetical protein
MGPVHFAVLGYDAVQHGPRRGDSQESPDNLFFNFLNPDAARGNPLQGAADIISVGRFAQSLDLSAAETGGSSIQVNPDAMVFFGHSQGSMHGSLALPFADVYKAAVLSGNGASIAHALLNKTSPVNIAAAVPLVLQAADSRELPGGDMHPVLTLISQWIDPADPYNFGRQLAREPLAGHNSKHLFQTYGLGDTYSPPITLELYAMVADVAVAESHSSADPPDDIGGKTEFTGANFPVVGNRVVDGQDITIALRQYGAPDDSDGHFVVFDVPTANADAARFLGMAAAGQTPQVGSD